MPVSPHSLLDGETRARIAHQLEDKGLLDWQIKTILARPKFLRINPMTNYTPVRTLNAVVTASVTTRYQMSMLDLDNVAATAEPPVVHVVKFMVFVCTGDDDFELLHRAHITVSALPGDTNVDIIRRASGLFDPAGHKALWEYDTLPAKAHDELYRCAGLLPDTVPASAYIGLTTVPNPDEWFYDLVDDLYGDND